MKKVAVEKCLTPVKDLLSKEGYSVKEVCNAYEDCNCDEFDAVVITGEGMNILGISDSTTNAVVINADGMTPDEVKVQLEKNFR